MVTETGLLAALRERRLLAIVRGSQRDAVVAASRTLIECGITCLEVSLTSADALDAIAHLTAGTDHAIIGAGTVLTEDDVHGARDAGAQFIVTPGLCPAIAAARSAGLPVLAGAFTPSEIIAAAGQGAAVKLFPASHGGPDYLRAVRAPLPEVAFVPVGGVDADSAAAYLAAGALAVGVGSPLLGDAADGGDLQQLRRRAASFRAAAEQAETPFEPR